MSDEALEALCPLDGRYRSRTAALRAYFSEAALIKYRVRVEVEYLLALSEATGLEISEDLKLKWRDVYNNFRGAKRCKELEATLNHDVKAVEYYLKEEYEALGLPAEGLELIHFGLTSQDVNHVAQPLAVAECVEAVLAPKYHQVLAALKRKAWDYREVAMLARTHGQPATPTILGKEFAVFATRLEKCLEDVVASQHTAKFGGATGLMNAHFVAYPDIDWARFADKFVTDASRGKLSRQKYTTQIEHYDGLAAFCHAVCRANVVLLDLCKDCWHYVSLGYFKQKVQRGEVGSSAMPHKVNPIDFENAEGNLGVSNALLEHLARKLPISRLQRDLSDSTALRTLGVPLGHSYLALTSLLRGLSKITLNPDLLRQDLDANWAVVAEAIQTILRKHAYPQPYEALKNLTRGHACTQADFSRFIDTLDIKDHVLKARLNSISPHNYTGRFDASPFQYHHDDDDGAGGGGVPDQQQQQQQQSKDATSY
ncbi:hypothetical protein CTAYLR_006196 [Chrysophaeum taylorii]|uniref:Adenylosuccinate lyase n=1 Tax=Chrysophaeum taylorii TaxID=2483200 RepID=A0AAD7XRC9_9STRA|nr:hypothetical protein CTAYLR_006196 [Chrysophaeum taylorii]